MLNGKLAMMWLKKETEKLAGSSLPETEFIGANGKIKHFTNYQNISGIFYKWNIITKEELENVVAYLNSIQEQNLIDNNSELQIDRNHPIEKKHKRI